MIAGAWVWACMSGAQLASAQTHAGENAAVDASTPDAAVATKPEKPVQEAPEPKPKPKPAEAQDQPTPQSLASDYRVRSIKATGDILRGVLAGNAVVIELEKKLADGIVPRVVLKPITQPKSGVAFARVEQPPLKMEIQGYVDDDRTAEPRTGIVATVPMDVEEGLYDVEVFLPSGAEVALERPQRLKVKSVNWILFWSALPIAGVVLFVWGLLRLGPSDSQHRDRKLLALLLLEPENETFSLSRLQFTLWSVAIIAAYMFIFLGQGLVENTWAFPSLEGFGMTFMISLGTLVTAQATSAAKGAKGAGSLHPSPADLIVHGGVLALERVQQLVWTVIGIGMFLVIVFKSYASANQLPVIPEELWVLMGISSAGYLAGKAARKPGPIVERVEAAAGSTILTITGKSFAKNARVLIDGKAFDGDVIPVAEDKARPEYVTALQITLTEGLDQWLLNERSLKVVNPDGQHAEWVATPIIDSATFVGAGKDTKLLVEGRYFGATPRWEIIGAQAGKAEVAHLQDSSAKKSKVASWGWAIPIANAADSGQVTVITSTGQRVTASWLRAPAQPPITPNEPTSARG